MTGHEVTVSRVCYIAGNFEAENSLNLAVTVVFGHRIHGNNTLLHSDIINVDFAMFHCYVMWPQSN